MNSLQFIEISAGHFIDMLWILLSLIGITNDDIEYFRPYIHDIENSINAFKNAYNTYTHETDTEHNLYDNQDNDKITDEDLDNIDKFYEQMDLDMSDNEIEFIKLQNELINITNENIMYPSEAFRNSDDPLRILHEMNYGQNKPNIISNVISVLEPATKSNDKQLAKIGIAKLAPLEKTSPNKTSPSKTSPSKTSPNKTSPSKDIMILKPIQGKTKKSEKKWGDCSGDDISDSTNSPISSYELLEYPPSEMSILNTKNKPINKHSPFKPINKHSPFKPILLNNLPKSPFDPKIKTVVQNIGIDSNKSTCVKWALGLCNEKHCLNNYSHSLWTDYNNGYTNMKYWKPNDLSKKNITYTEIKSYKGTKYYRSEKIMSKENTYIISERNNNGIYCVKNYLIYNNLK